LYIASPLLKIILLISIILGGEKLDGGGFGHLYRLIWTNINRFLTMKYEIQKEQAC